MAEYPLLPIPKPEFSDRPDQRRRSGLPKMFSKERQQETIGPKFQRLQDAFSNNRNPQELRNDPNGIAPERTLVFEVSGTIDGFYHAVRRIPGLEYLGEQETDFHVDDELLIGNLYLVMPDIRALEELLRLWNMFKNDQPFEHGFGRWKKLFQQLNDLRTWGPVDRIPQEIIDLLQKELESQPDSTVRMEVELWSYEKTIRQQYAIERFEQAVQDSAGVIIDRASIPEIAYEAALIDLPAANTRKLLERSDDISLVFCDEVMLVRPQTTVSFPTEIESLGPDQYIEPVATQNEQPIVALLDGVPVQAHQRLKDRIKNDDPDNLGDMSVVSKRRHGTEMASLILHGDLNCNEPVLPRLLYVRPVLCAPDNEQLETSPRDRLLIDTIYRAILRMKKGDNAGGPTAEEVFIVNLSLGDPRRPFAGTISPWARLLDYLAEKFGILFIVSAGNITFPLEISGYTNSLDWSQASPEERQKSILLSLKEQRSQRTLLSPAEALNVLTVGSWHNDNHTVNQADDTKPYIDSGPNITSAMGLGYRKIIKPDIFMPGGKETLQAYKSGKGLRAYPDRARFGLRVATISTTGSLNYDGLTNGTSAATALATRAGHRIFDSLLDNGLMDNVDPMFYGVIIKALLAHRAKWDQEIGIMLDTIYEPHGRGKHVERKDNIASVLGFGPPNTKESIICAPNRATLVGSGIFGNTERSHLYQIPLPPSLEKVTEPRSVTITLAWFSPINVRSRNYRNVRLEAKAQNFETEAGVSRAKLQPSDKSIPRGTLFHVRYEGKKSVSFIEDGHLLFNVFWRAQDNNLDKPVRYGLAVTIEAGEHIPVYQEVRERLAVGVRAEG